MDEKKGGAGASLLEPAQDDAVFHWGREVDVDWRMVSWVTIRDQVGFLRTQSGSPYLDLEHESGMGLGDGLGLGLELGLGLGLGLDLGLGLGVLVSSCYPHAFSPGP